MDSIPRLETTRERAESYASFTDNESLSGETPVNEVDLSDPILPFLPFEGYRILDTQSIQATPVKVCICPATHELFAHLRNSQYAIGPIATRLL
jgi:hypothetical protein